MNWLLEVTDLKQYTCCPRIVFYRYCLPRVRPITVLMEEGIRCHLEEENREERRSLRPYGLVDGERFFHLALQSNELELTGRIDLAIAIPTREAVDAEAVVVEYKYSEHKAGPQTLLLRDTRNPKRGAEHEGVNRQRQDEGADRQDSEQRRNLW